MVRNSMAIINAMQLDERQALEDGYRSSGHQGTLDQFFEEQAHLYKTAHEGDPRLKTWFYGPTLDRFNGQSALQGLRSAL